MNKFTYPIDSIEHGISGTGKNAWELVWLGKKRPKRYSPTSMASVLYSAGKDKRKVSEHKEEKK